MTRTSDTATELDTRSNIAIATNADCMVSIHCDADGANMSFNNGAYAYVSNGNYCNASANNAAVAANYILAELNTHRTWISGQWK